MAQSFDPLLEKVCYVLADYTDQLVSPSSNLVTDLNLDSLSSMDLMLRLENEFQLSDLEYDPRHMETVDDLARVIRDRVADRIPDRVGR